MTNSDKLNMIQKYFIEYIQSWEELNVKEGLLDIILSRQLQLGGKELWERNKIACKIENAKNEVILDEG